MSEYVYRAYQMAVGEPGCWMVKRYHVVSETDDIYIYIYDNYTEALVYINTYDPAVAIQAAIDRGSWA